MTKGKLFVLEGACDGIGKSTQYQELANHLQRLDYLIKTHHFPSYNTYQAKAVEEYLKGTFGNPKDLSPYFVNSLYATDRAITWNESLKSEYEAGKIILLDRYTTSSLIYQSALIQDEEEKKKFIDYICDLEYNKLGIKKPDLVIYLYASYENIKKLRENRKENEGIKKDIHESNDEFLKKVYENGNFVANYLGWEKVKCDTKDEMLAIEEIHDKVYSLVKTHL